MKKVLIGFMCLAFALGLIACEKQISHQAEVKTTEVFDIFAVFEGQIDSNTVELIMEDSTAKTFRVSENVKEKLKGISKGDEIIIVYEISEQSTEAGKVEVWTLTDFSPAVDDENSLFPKEKLIGVTVEGMAEERVAKLNRLPSYYVMYVLDGYTMTKIDNDTTRIQMDYDPDFYVDIKILPWNSDLAKWEQDIKVKLSGFAAESDGIHKLDPAAHFDEHFRDAYYFYLGSAANRGSVMYMMTKVGEDLFEYKLNIPSKEAAEGAVPSLWAMLKTIQLGR